MENIRIILIDKDERYRKGLAEFLNGNGFTVYGSFHDPRFIDFHLPYPPKIVVMAQNGIKTTNLNAVWELKKKYPIVKVIISAFFKETISFHDFKQLGIDGLYYKADNNSEIILNVINQVLAGNYCYQKEINRK